MSNGKTLKEFFPHDVDVIHATAGGKDQERQWNVQKGTWNDLGLNSRGLYQLRRYKKGE